MGGIEGAQELRYVGGLIHVVLSCPVRLQVRDRDKETERQTQTQTQTDRLSARWLSLVRRRVVSESVLVHTHTSSRRSPASVCCLVCGAKIAEARTRRAAPRWRIDPGRSDLCSERQHARRDRLAAYGAPSPACRSPASTGSAPASAAHDLYINLYNLVYIPEAWLARGSSAPDA